MWNSTIDEKEPMYRRRWVHAWALYDWANSAFATIYLTVLFPPYLVLIFPQGIFIGSASIPPESIWSYLMGFSALCAGLLMPILGAISDLTGKAYRAWLGFSGLGIFMCFAIGTTPPRSGEILLFLFFLAHLGFAGGNVFYNALLPAIASEEKYDRVSSLGYAVGYLGGGLYLLFTIFWLKWASNHGFSQTGAIRHALFGVGIWWGLFGGMSFLGLSDIVLPPPVLSLKRAFREGWLRFIQTFRNVRKYQVAFRFLIAFFLYNDGVQTTIIMATLFGQRELGMSVGELVILILAVQFLALPGALLWGRIAERIGTKHAIQWLLVTWIGATIPALFIQTKVAFWAMAVLIAVSLGGIQALSRSYFARVIPEGYEAEFFGFYSVVSKFSSILGPLWVGLSRQFFHTLRIGVVGLIAFYFIGFFSLQKLPKTLR